MHMSMGQASGLIALARGTVVLGPTGWLSRLVAAFINDLDVEDSPTRGLYSEFDVRMVCSALSDGGGRLKLTTDDLATISDLLCSTLEVAVRLESGALFVPSMLPLAPEADRSTFLDSSSDVVSYGRRYTSASPRDHVPPGVFASLHVRVLGMRECAIRASWSDRVVFNVMRRECAGIEVRLERGHANSCVGP